MPAFGELYNMCISYPQFAIRPKLIIQNMKESKLINAANSQIVPRRVKGKRKQWLICI